LHGRMVTDARTLVLPHRGVTKGCVAVACSAAIVTRMKQRILISGLLLVAMSGSIFAEPAQVTTVILVRHAEKVDASNNPDLSAAGYERAKRLAALLRDVPIDAVYTTPFHRTRKTAGPAATARDLTPIEVHADKKLAGNTAARVREHRGKSVLVVGHSNTIPDTLRALGFKDAPAIDDSEYDRLFICTLIDGAPGSFVALRY
jgi:phosphohistidine phosphatase SixA